MVNQLERSAAQNAIGYRWKAVLAGMLGYGVLGGVLLLFLGLTTFMVVLMFTPAPG